MYLFYDVFYIILIGMSLNNDSTSQETSSSSFSNGGKFESMSGNCWVSQMEYSFWHVFKLLEMFLAAVYVNASFWFIIEQHLRFSSVMWFPLNSQTYEFRLYHAVWLIDSLQTLYHYNFHNL